MRNREGDGKRNRVGKSVIDGGAKALETQRQTLKKGAERRTLQAIHHNQSSLIYNIKLVRLCYYNFSIVFFFSFFY